MGQIGLQHGPSPPTLRRNFFFNYRGKWGMQKQSRISIAEMAPCRIGGWMGSMVLVLLLAVLAGGGRVQAWTGEIRGSVVCDVCADSSIGPEDHVLQGAEVAVLCITKSGEVLNYQAFTNSKGIYTVAETMPESERWDSCLARPINSFSERCSQRGGMRKGVKFNYDLSSGYSHTVRPFLYKPTTAPTYCA